MNLPHRGDRHPYHTGYGFYRVCTGLAIPSAGGTPSVVAAPPGHQAVFTTPSIQLELPLAVDLIRAGPGRQFQGGNADPRVDGMSP